LVLGRYAEGAAALSGDPRLSRRHAVLRRISDGHVIADLHSSNGTFVNQVRITWPTRLRPGDELVVGASRLRVARIDETAKPSDTTADEVAANTVRVLQPVLGTRWDIAAGARRRRDPDPVPVASTRQAKTAHKVESAHQVALAFRFFAQRRYDDCERLFSQLAGDPEFAAESHYRLGMIRVARGDLRGAVVHLQRCIAHEPTHVDALDRLRAIAEEYAALPAADLGQGPAASAQRVEDQRLQAESHGEADQFGLRANSGLGTDPTEVAVHGVHRDSHGARRPAVGESRRDVPQHLRLLRRQGGAHGLDT
jgi:pSer/pThr/pTyr-binding forkhead associated (FHA) protein